MTDMLTKHIEEEIAEAAKLSSAGDDAAAFRHLERAHVLGQSSTYHHMRVHWLMLKHGIRTGDKREIAGQALRIAERQRTAAGNLIPRQSGGANVIR